jgi:hypothetical protein
VHTGGRGCGGLELGVRRVGLLGDDSEGLWCWVSGKSWRAGCRLLTMVADAEAVCKVFGEREEGRAAGRRDTNWIVISIGNGVALEGLLAGDVEPGADAEAQGGGSDAPL